MMARSPEYVSFVSRQDSSAPSGGDSMHCFLPER